MGVFSVYLGAQQREGDDGGNELGSNAHCESLTHSEVLLRAPYERHVSTRDPHRQHARLEAVEHGEVDGGVET